MSKATESCQEDVKQFCSHVGPGRKRASRILACLKSHEPDLSESCRAQREAIRAGVEGFIKACRKDTRQFCKGRIFLRQCLMENESDLTEQCRTAVTREGAATR